MSTGTRRVVGPNLAGTPGAAQAAGRSRVTGAGELEAEALGFGAGALAAEEGAAPGGVEAMLAPCAPAAGEGR
jgi:hypothetical protein